jgi:hypothetical protein
MVFKGPAGFARVVNIVMNIFMCSGLSLYVLWTAQSAPGNETLPILTPLAFFVSLAMSFCVGYFFGDVVPALSWGQRLCGAISIKNRVAVHLLSVVVHDFCMITCVSFSCFWINSIQVIGLAATFGAWIAAWGPLLLLGYAILALLLPVSFKLATAISGFDPAAPQSLD